MRNILGASVFRTFSIAALLLVLLTNISGASTFCDTIINPTLQYSNSLNNLLTDSIIIMGAMIALTAILYLFATVLKIDRIVRFIKSEIGEIGITILIVIAFLGTFTAINALTATNFFAISGGNFNSGVFSGDCNNLVNIATNLIVQLRNIYFEQIYANFISGFGVHLDISHFGSVAAPLAGFSLITSVISLTMQITFVMIGINLSGAGVLGIFYNIFPIFLYLGILLRTFPYTRAAGGAFLGAFAGFYLMFPLLLALLIPVQSSALGVLPNAQPLPVFNAAAQTLSNYGSLISGAGVVNSFIQNTLGDEAYVIFAILLSFIISYDFMEAVGDLLGAPSLNSSQTLKKVL